LASIIRRKADRNTKSRRHTNLIIDVVPGRGACFRSIVAGKDGSSRAGRFAPRQRQRSKPDNKIADRMEANLEKLATAETWDNGKPIREAMAAGRCGRRPERPAVHGSFD
jgi:hypothetical protein